VFDLLLDACTYSLWARLVALTSTTAIASTTEQLIQQGEWVDVAPGMVAMFGGMVALTQRELIAHLLETEADWPWAKQPTRQ
jgi:hypothetical protein